MIGMVLGHAYDDMPQILHIPSHGFIKPWQVVSTVKLLNLAFTKMQNRSYNLDLLNVKFFDHFDLDLVSLVKISRSHTLVPIINYDKIS